MSFAAPEEHRDGELLLRGLRPGDGADLNRATVSSHEHLREFMEWARPDTTVEDSEGYVRLSRARWLAGEEWSLGARVLRAMVDWADADWPIQKLTWQCDSRNLASARVAEKCGFQLEGRLREHVPAVAGGGRRTTLLFGLVRSDPRPWRSRP